MGGAARGSEFEPRSNLRQNGPVRAYAAGRGGAGRDGAARDCRSGVAAATLLHLASRQ
jgi:hypothetical protein